MNDTSLRLLRRLAGQWRFDEHAETCKAGRGVDYDFAVCSRCVSDAARDALIDEGHPFTGESD